MKAKLLFCALSFLMVSGAVRGVMGQVLGQPYRLSDKESGSDSTSRREASR